MRRGKSLETKQGLDKVYPDLCPTLLVGCCHNFKRPATTHAAHYKQQQQWTRVGESPSDACSWTSCDSR